MQDLEKHLLAAVDDKQIIGIDFGDTIDPTDVPKLVEAISRGVKVKGHYTGEVTVKVVLNDVWKYYEGDNLIEDETGCAHITAEYGGQTATTVLQWAHVNGSTPVDTDGDGE